jgi:peptidoglycan hydrolase-like protein with peptidoglycan-binding domain
MMRLNRGRLFAAGCPSQLWVNKYSPHPWMMAGLFAALLLIAGAGPSGAAAQTKAASRTKAKSTASTRAGAKAGSRTTKAAARKTTARTRGQTAPTPDRIIEIQQALAREGFYSGTASGKWDAPTSQAMSNFQRAKGLTPTGKLGALSLQKLGLGSEIAGRAAPNPQADTRPSVLSESELNQPEPKEPTEP